MGNMVGRTLGDVGKASRLWFGDNKGYPKKIMGVKKTNVLLGEKKIIL